MKKLVYLFFTIFLLSAKNVDVSIDKKSKPEIRKRPSPLFIKSTIYYFGLLDPAIVGSKYFDKDIPIGGYFYGTKASGFGLSLGGVKNIKKHYKFFDIFFCSVGVEGSLMYHFFYFNLEGNPEPKPGQDRKNNYNTRNNLNKNTPYLLNYHAFRVPVVLELDPIGFISRDERISIYPFAKLGLIFQTQIYSREKSKEASQYEIAFSDFDFFSIYILTDYGIHIKMDRFNIDVGVNGDINFLRKNINPIAMGVSIFASISYEIIS